MVQPITPDEAVQRKSEGLPDYVLEGFNEMISRRIDTQKRARFTQNEVIDVILGLAPEHVTRHTLFENKWLDVEKTYRDAGWHVKYDKPDYTESYAAYFVFYK